MSDTPPVRSGRGIQKEDVFAAADSLLAEGKRPTIERVRQKIGRGSPNTVSPMLEHWFATLGPRMGGAGGLAPASTEGGSPPQSGLPEGVQSAVAALWDVAQREARTQARTEVAHDLEDLAQREQALASAQAVLAQREEAFAATRASLDAALAGAQQANAALEQQLQAAAAEAKEVRRRLEAELQHLNTRLTEATQAEQHVRQEAAQALAAREKDLRQADERHAAQQRHWIAELDRARQQLKSTDADLTQMKKRLEKTEETAAHRLEAQLQQGEVAAKQAAAAHQLAADLREGLAARDAQIAELRTQAALLGDRQATWQTRLEEERAAHESTRVLLAQTLSARIDKSPKAQRAKPAV